MMSEALTEFIKGIATILNVTDEKTIRKGVEFITVLNYKPQVNCSATCKGVICLDIASSFSSKPINKDEAVKHSGCKKRSYTNLYNNISKLLNVDKVYSVKEICLLCNAYDVKELAVQLFEKFKSNCNRVHYDFEHPMYGCAAVWAICRKNKIKINNSVLIEISRIKKSELDELTKEFESFLMKSTAIRANSESIPTNNLQENVKTGGSPLRKRKQCETVMNDAEYLAWKKRMLED